MRLGTKLLLAPVLTGLIALSGGAVNALLAAQEASSNGEAFNANLQSLRTIDQVKERMGLMHAGVYRSLALMASLDEAAVAAFRRDLKAQVDAVVQTAGTLAGPDGQASPLAPQIAEAGQALAAYGKQADNAIDMASVDPNTGVAAMQNADASFKQATTAMAARMRNGLTVNGICIKYAIDSVPTTCATDRTPPANALPVTRAAGGAGVTINFARIPASRSQTI